MSTPTRVAITHIGQIAIPVQEVARAVAFYRDVLGLPFLFQTAGLAFFQCGEVRLMLSVPEGPNAPTQAAAVYYQVDDINRAYDSLREAGAKLVDDPHLIAKLPDHDLWMAFVEDTEGNLVGIMSEVRG